MKSRSILMAAATALALVLFASPAEAGRKKHCYNGGGYGGGGYYRGGGYNYGYCPPVRYYRSSYYCPPSYYSAPVYISPPVFQIGFRFGGGDYCR